MKENYVCCLKEQGNNISNADTLADLSSCSCGCYRHSCSRFVNSPAAGTAGTAVSGPVSVSVSVSVVIVVVFVVVIVVVVAAAAATHAYYCCSYDSSSCLTCWWQWW